MKKWAALFIGVFVIALVGSYLWLQSIQKDHEVSNLQQPAVQESSSDTGVSPDHQQLDGLGLTRSDSQNALNVDVTFLPPLTSGIRNELDFQIALNTHSVDVSGFDMPHSVVLQNGRGEKLTEGFTWKLSSQEGMHHRTGQLTVVLPPGSKFLDAGAKSVTMIIKNLGGVNERTFTWDGEALEKVR